MSYTTYNSSCPFLILLYMLYSMVLPEAQTDMSVNSRGPSVNANEYGNLSIGIWVYPRLYMSSSSCGLFTCSTYCMVLDGWNIPHPI